MTAASLPEIRGFRSVPLDAWALVCTLCEKPPPMPVFSTEDALAQARDHLTRYHPERLLNAVEDRP